MQGRASDILEMPTGIAKPTSVDAISPVKRFLLPVNGKRFLRQVFFPAAW